MTNECPSCQTNLLSGALICDRCAYPLWKLLPSPNSTIGFVASKIGTNPFSPWIADSYQGEDVLLYVRGYTTPLLIEHFVTLIGRMDLHAAVYPDIDLTPYGAQQRGVSRYHACIIKEQTQLTLKDLDSLNGTYLNGQRLFASETCSLRSGDEIQLGKLALTLIYRDDLFFGC